MKWATYARPHGVSVLPFTTCKLQGFLRSNFDLTKDCKLYNAKLLNLTVKVKTLPE